MSPLKILEFGRFTEFWPFQIFDLKGPFFPGPVVFKKSETLLNAKHGDRFFDEMLKNP